MANVTLRGTIVNIQDSEIVGTNFEKRVFWLQERDVEYPSTWNLEMQQGDCNKLDAYQRGDHVECQVSIRGRAGQKRDGSGPYCINTLKCWKIALAGQAQQPAYSAPASAAAKVTPPPAQSDFSNEPDDLPF
jgi:hypothetical protein